MFGLFAFFSSSFAVVSVAFVYSIRRHCFVLVMQIKMHTLHKFLAHTLQPDVGCSRFKKSFTFFLRSVRNYAKSS